MYSGHCVVGKGAGHVRRRAESWEKKNFGLYVILFRVHETSTKSGRHPMNSF
jgi:hypothetical protein